MPDITSINPLGGVSGTIVTIVFSIDPSTVSTIKFNTTTAQKVDVGANYISVVVPIDATSGTIKYTVGAAENTGPFFVIGPPKIDRVLDAKAGDPQSPVNLDRVATEIKPGTIYWIDGSNFWETQQMGYALINQLNLNILSWSNILVKVQTPQTAVTDGFVVVTDLGASNKFYLSGNEDTTTLPYIEQIVPTEATSGDTVSVEGKNFGLQTGHLFVGETEVFPISWNGTAIAFNVTTSLKAGYVKVTNTAGISNLKYLSIDTTTTADTEDTESTTTPVFRTSKATGRTQPNYAKPGDTLVISGTSFGRRIGTVTAPDGTKLEVMSWSDTAISVKIPTTAISGNYTIANDKGDVRTTSITIDTTPDTSYKSSLSGNYNMPSTTMDAIYDNYGVDLSSLSNSNSSGIRPFIKALNEYTLAPGREIIVTGLNFGSSGSVYVNALDATAGVTSWGEREVKFTCPDGVITGTLVVVTEMGYSNLIRVKAKAGAPVIYAAYPGKDAELGKDLILIGDNFGEGKDYTKNYLLVGSGPYSQIPRSIIEVWTNSKIKLVLSSDYDYIEGYVQVVSDTIPSNKFELNFVGNSAAPSSKISLGRIQNRYGQLETGGSLSQETAAMLNALSSRVIVRNLDADKLDGKEWEDIKEFIDETFDWEYRKNNTVQIAKVGCDSYGNINIVEGKGIKIMPFPEKNEVLIIPDWSPLANDKAWTGGLADVGFCTIFGNCEIIGPYVPDGNPEDEWLIDIVAGDGILATISNSPSERIFGGNVYVLEPDFGDAEWQCTRGNHTHVRDYVEHADL